MDMRLGKTICTIRFLKLKSEAKRVIIVAPYSTFCGWLDEHPDIKRIDINADPIDYSSAPGWFIINKEAHLRNDFLQYPWDAVVMDESFIQNPKAKVTKYILKKTKNISIRVLLTGTPAPENELQYYCQLEFLFPSIFKVKNYWEYRARYARIYGFEWRLNEVGKKNLEKILREKCFILKCKDVGLYPDPVYEKRFVKIQMKEYLKAEKYCMDSFDNIMKFSGQRWNYLRKLCSGKEKEQELLVLLNGELTNKKVVIWTWYIEEVKRLSNLLGCPAIYGEVSPDLRAEYVNNFNNSDANKHIVIQPETMKFGSDLSGADTEIYFSSPVALLTRQQSEKRIINLKRKYPILIIDIIAQDTVDEDILASLEGKENGQQLLERVKNRFLRHHD